MREKRLKKNEMSALPENTLIIGGKGSEKARCCISLLEKDMSLPEEMNDKLTTYRTPGIEQKIVLDSIEDISNLNFKQLKEKQE